MRPKNSRLWMRLGDAGEYEEKESPYGAGYEVGSFLGELGGVGGTPDITWVGKGVDVDPGFTGYNYISLFWGDEDAQPVSGAELTASEGAEFKRGLYEGADIREEVRKPAKRKVKTKAKRKSGGGNLAVGGMR